MLRGPSRGQLGGKPRGRRDASHLAPITPVFMPSTPFSSTIYSSAGRVEKAGSRPVSARSPTGWLGEGDSRPKNSGERCQGAVFRLEALQERRERDHVRERMPEVEVDEGKRVCPVHCMQSVAAVSSCSPRRGRRKEKSTEES